MKPIVTKHQEDVVIKETGLSGKPIITQSDDVGFLVYDVTLQSGTNTTLKSLKPRHNHIYYVMRGRAVMTSPDGKDVQLDADDVLALDSSTIVNIVVKDELRMAVCYVINAPDINSAKFYHASMKDIQGSSRDIDWQHGQSRRYLLEKDGFNITVTNTLCHAGMVSPMHYPRQIECVYMFKGNGSYVWENGAKLQAFKNENKDDGTMFLIDYKAHHLHIDTPNAAQCICFFYPPLKGEEAHDFKNNITNAY